MNNTGVFAGIEYFLAGDMFMDNKKKVVVITGASEGIGRCLAKRFARAGDTLVLIARSQDKLKETADLVAGHAQEVMVSPTDITKPDQVKTAVEKIINTFGLIDTLINNAGAVVFSRIADTGPDLMRYAFEVNFWGAVYMIQAVYPFIKKQKSCKIVNVSSTAGFWAFPGNGY
jgi:NADP-dependent 3-hydroxy acid dehydrogenase YdfG